MRAYAEQRVRKPKQETEEKRERKRGGASETGMATGMPAFLGAATLVQEKPIEREETEGFIDFDIREGKGIGPTTLDFMPSEEASREEEAGVWQSTKTFGERGSEAVGPEVEVGEDGEPAVNEKATAERRKPAFLDAAMLLQEKPIEFEETEGVVDADAREGNGTGATMLDFMPAEEAPGVEEAGVWEPTEALGDWSSAVESEVEVVEDGEPVVNQKAIAGKTETVPEAETKEVPEIVAGEAAGGSEMEAAAAETEAAQAGAIEGQLAADEGEASGAPIETEEAATEPAIDDAGALRAWQTGVQRAVTAIPSPRMEGSAAADTQVHQAGRSAAGAIEQAGEAIPAEAAGTIPATPDVERPPAPPASNPSPPTRNESTKPRISGCRTRRRPRSSPVRCTRCRGSGSTRCRSRCFSF